MSLSVTAPNAWTRWVVGLAVLVGCVGVVMRLADLRSAPSAAMVLLFLAVAPTTMIYGLLRSFDPFARILLACTANVAFLTLLATLMLAEHVWSPVGGLLVVAGITLVGLAAQQPPVRRRLAVTVASWHGRHDRPPPGGAIEP